MSQFIPSRCPYLSGKVCGKVGVSPLSDRHQKEPRSSVLSICVCALGESISHREMQDETRRDECAQRTEQLNGAVRSAVKIEYLLRRVPRRETATPHDSTFASGVCRSAKSKVE
jgi:hypothetical protein